MNPPMAGRPGCFPRFLQALGLGLEQRISETVDYRDMQIVENPTRITAEKLFHIDVLNYHSNPNVAFPVVRRDALDFQKDGDIRSYRLREYVLEQIVRIGIPRTRGMAKCANAWSRIYMEIVDMDNIVYEEAFINWLNNPITAQNALEKILESSVYKEGLARAEPFLSGDALKITFPEYHGAMFTPTVSINKDQANLTPVEILILEQYCYVACRMKDVRKLTVDSEVEKLAQRFLTRLYKQMI